MTWLGKSLAGVAVAISLANAASAQQHATADTVVATVNGAEITLGHLIIARESLPAQYRDLPPEVLYNGLLDQLVQQTVLVQSLDGRDKRHG
jgi:peptidyl-prolyl cis-trans isomerase C